MQKTTARIQRLENVLYMLKKFNTASRSQLQTIFKLGTDRSACRILKDIEEDGYIHSFRTETTEKVYYLSKKGRELVGAEKRISKTHLIMQVNHYLMRNQFYIYSGLPSSWDNEVKINKLIIADAMYTEGVNKQIYNFVEIDNLQNFKSNLSKIKRYKEIAKLTDQPFKIHFVTSTHARKIRLERHVSDLNSVVYLYSDLI